MAAIEEPPLEGTPGDLLMVLREALTRLEEIRDTDPGNTNEIDAVAATTVLSISYWIKKRINLQEKALH